MAPKRLALVGLAVFAVVGLGAVLLPWLQTLVGDDCTAEFFAEFYPDLWRKVALGAVGLLAAVAAGAAAWGGWKTAADGITPARRRGVLAGVAAFALLYFVVPFNAISVDGSSASYSCYVYDDAAG